MKKTIKATALLFSLIIAHITYGQTTFNYKDDFKKILAKTKEKNDNLSYDKLLNRFNSNDTTLSDFEVLALLIGFTDKPDYKPYEDIDTEGEIYKLNGEKKYNTALELGQKFIKTHPLSVKTLFEIAYSFHKLDKEDSANSYLYRGKAIFKAMYFSGDGKSKETPTFALGPADGQDYIYKFVGARIGTMGSGRDNNGNFLDILEAIFQNDQSITLYFIIQHATAKMFDGKSIVEELKDQNKKRRNKN
jgi:hypothetical protein